MRFCLIISVLLMPLFSFAQKKMVISGVVTDAETNTALRDISVYIENQEGYKTLTNRLGKYYLSISFSENEQPVIVFKSALFDIYKYKLSKAEIRKYHQDTLELDVQLKWYTLPTAYVSAAPDTVFGSKEISVSDFEFYEDHFVMLVYEKRLDKGSKVIYVDQDQRILSSFTVPDVAKEMYKDAMGKIHVVCEHKVYQVDIQDDVLHLFPLEKDFYERQVKPWVDTTGDGKIYYSNFVWYYPEFDYYAYDTKDTTFKKIYTVTDEPLMELYRAQYKYVDGHDKVLAMNAEIQTGIDKEIWVAIWTGFPNSIYYHQLYAPMFIKEDTILIFDHYTNKMYRFNSENEPIDSIDISYHIASDKRDWEELLLKDAETNAIFSVFLRGGKYYLKELNTSTGEVKKVYRLTYKYPERLKVKDNYAYYIYRPFESPQKKFLYKERLYGIGE